MSDDAANPGANDPGPDTDEAVDRQPDATANNEDPEDGDPPVDEPSVAAGEPTDEGDATDETADAAGPTDDSADDRRGRRRERRRKRRAERERNRQGRRADDDGEAFDPADVDDVARNLGRREVERLFSILEAAFTGPDRLDDESLDTLLVALERAIVEPASIDSAELDRMLSLWEAVLVDAASADDARRALDVFDAAGVDADRRNTDVFRFLERLGLDDLLGGGAGDAARAFTSGEESVDPYRLARLVATVTQNATLNSGQSSVRVGTELARAAATARSPAELLDDSRDIALSELERLGVDTGVDPQKRTRRRDDDEDDRTLRERGEALLEQSADLDYEDSYHPAHDHVVEQLAPDEGRILRLLATEGPQPMVDVLDLGWLPLGSTVVARHLTMLAAKAGCRHDEREPAYLHNLERLGLVWFAEDPVDDLERYRVLEAQPNVERALEGVTREKFDRRSIHLTPFGAEFCRVALELDVVDGATAALGDVGEA
ncbi:Abi-alpha family protein [Halorarius litoreus]|uniref:Abi-alpha family protein n=1 Tax=Halorarius litoreus TaxID=2962676 RepID=UPI0020CE71B4|nr:Abi-alpha family protein [Halorarius litoreus]